MKSTLYASLDGVCDEFLELNHEPMSGSHRVKLAAFSLVQPGFPLRTMEQEWLFSTIHVNDWHRWDVPFQKSLVFLHDTRQHVLPEVEIRVVAISTDLVWRVVAEHLCHESGDCISNALLQ